MIELDSRTTALVLIDLRNAAIGPPMKPRSGLEVAARGRDVAAFFRKAGATVVPVRVNGLDRYFDAVSQTGSAPDTGVPDKWSALWDELEQPGDIVIVKRRWGTFHRAELEQQLRRRGIRTIVLGGIATDFGVEATARHAWEHGYNVVLAEDLCTSLSLDLHEASVRAILPRISRVVHSAEISLIQM
jgi:nicotinamidase-related amidase